MKTIHDLSQLRWTLSGYRPYEWLAGESLKMAPFRPEIEKISASVPGSVQKALLEAKLIPDWNIGFNSRLCEWVEHRHWVYEAHIPDEWFQDFATARLKFEGLDSSGWICLNWKELAKFSNAHVPHVVDLTGHLHPSSNHIQIIFDLPPRWLGVPYYSNQITQWKPRFNYSWDWTERIVQIGIWNKVLLEVCDSCGSIERIKLEATADPSSFKGRLRISGNIMSESSCTLKVTLSDQEHVIRSFAIHAKEFMSSGLQWDDLDIELWWPNGHGSQKLYYIRVDLLDDTSRTIDTFQRRLGFKHVRWEPCQGAPETADPWLCIVNSRPIFLQGINWTPIRPNFADVTFAEYKARLDLYRDMGVNTMRVWGGAFLEKDTFYDLCDELGFLVWQELPLSSSMIDNAPPDDPASIAEMANIARSYIQRRSHHVCLFVWCGGNELQTALDGTNGIGTPLNTTHPMLRHLAEIFAELDSSRRFLPTSASGPRFMADEKTFGKGQHWDVHGPWKPHVDLERDWVSYWQNDDALMRSEVGSPAPSSADLIRRYKGDCDELPASNDNPLWRKVQWWPEWDVFIAEKVCEPKDLEEYVQWGQERQAHALSIAAQACKKRFPRCGGFILWMGHDSYPCPTNTSIIDFEGNPKPAVSTLAKIFKTD